MKAHLRSVRIAPKKANLVAKMVRTMSVPKALASLERTNKKAARILEEVIKSAASNAKQNDKQNPDELIIKSIIVNKAITYHRGIPMARGRMRRIRKFLSHITVELGHPEVMKNGKEVKEAKKTKPLERPSPQGSAGQVAGAAKNDGKKKSTSLKKQESSSQSKETPVKLDKKHSKKSEGSDNKSPKTADASKSLGASNSSK